LSALDELREGLREAARRDVEAHRGRSRRRRLRVTGALALVLVGGAAAAGAADLISVGEPARDQRKSDPTYLSPTGAPLDIAVTAHSGGKLPYGVGIYGGKKGKRCALAGEARGSSLGVVRDGTFRPYAGAQIGACGNPGQSFFALAHFGDHTLVFGRAAPSVRVVRAIGGERSATPGRGGAFLFVFAGAAPPGGFGARFEDG